MKPGIALRLAARWLALACKPRTLAQIVLFVTRHCDASCGHCFSAGALGKGQEMSLREYEKLASSLGTILQVVLSGGEPFLRDDLPQIVRLFHENAGAAVFSIPTNGGSGERGLRAAELMAASCPAAHFNLLVSLDAADGGHDRLRGRPGLFAAALDFCRGLQELARKRDNMRVLVCTAVLPENINGLDALEDRLKKAFGAQAPMQVLQLDQRADSALYRDPGLLGKASAFLSRAAAGPGQGFLQRSVSNIFVNRPNRWIFRRMRGEYHRAPCCAEQRSIVILPDGRAFPCEPFAFDTRFADLRLRAPRLADFSWDLSALRRSRDYLLLARAAAQDDCGRCAWSCAAVNSLLYPKLFGKSTNLAKKRSTSLWWS